MAAGASVVRAEGLMSIRLTLLLKKKHKDCLNQSSITLEHFLILHRVTYRLFDVKRVLIASSFAFLFSRESLKSHHEKVFAFFRTAVEGAKDSSDGCPHSIKQLLTEGEKI